MSTEKRQRAIQKRKKETLKKAKKSAQVLQHNTFKSEFNENKSQVIDKMIEFGIYEKSLEREDWFIVHGNYLFTWKNGEYNYLYSTKPCEIENLVKMFEFYCEE